MLDYKSEIEPHLRGIWPDVLSQYGVEVGDFKGRNTKNGPCPLCGGDDRAHWQEDSGRVSLYCRQCAADKMKSAENVIMELYGMGFKQFCDDMIKYLNLTPLEKREVINKKPTKVSFSFPACHKQDPEAAALFVSKVKGNGHFLVKSGHDGDMKGVYLAVYNHLQQLVNIAKVVADGYRFQAGGISYGAFGVIHGNDRVILCVNHRDAIKVNTETGATVFVTFYMTNLNFCVYKVPGFKSLEVALTDYEIKEDLFDFDNSVIKA